MARRFSFVVALALVGCNPGESPVLPPSDSSWLDFGVDGANEATICEASDAPIGDGVVMTDGGPVRGAQSAGVWSFKAIPFAAPPIDALRWRPPQPASCWSDVRDATNWGPKCPQTGGGSEDCLQLNVWTKSPSSSASKPVLVFVHGGGFVGGSAVDVALDGRRDVLPRPEATRIYDAERFVAREDVVVVTINYRLGALGFFAHHALDVEDEHHASGNYGLLDQLAALQWVQRNAPSFGGDPKRVTVVGESSVCALVASRRSQGLFSQAIMQSGECSTRTIREAEAYGEQLVEASKCDSAPDVAACMRALAADRIVASFPARFDLAGAGSPYAPVVDYSLLTGAPLDVVSAGGHVALPIIFGNAAAETNHATSLAPAASEADYESAVAAIFPATKDAVLAHYPSTDYASPRAAFVALTSDARFVCPTRRAARAFLDGQDLPVFRYWLSNASHGDDSRDLFDHTDADPSLVASFQDALARFVVDGAPGDPWPKYDFTDPYLLFDSTIGTGSGLRKSQCDFWDSLVP